MVWVACEEIGMSTYANAWLGPIMPKDMREWPANRDRVWKRMIEKTPEPGWSMRKGDDE